MFNGCKKNQDDTTTCLCCGKNLGKIDTNEHKYCQFCGNPLTLKSSAELTDVVLKGQIDILVEVKEKTLNSKNPQIVIDEIITDLKQSIN